MVMTNEQFNQHLDDLNARIGAQITKCREAVEALVGDFRAKMEAELFPSGQAEALTGSEESPLVVIVTEAVEPPAKPERDMDFLADLQKPVPLASDEPDVVPDVPEIAEMVKVLDLEQDAPAAPMPPVLDWLDDNWAKLCAWVIKTNAEKQAVDAFLISKNLVINQKQERHLDNLRTYRKFLLAANNGWDLKTAQGQADVTPAEAEAFAQLVAPQPATA